MDYIILALNMNWWWLGPWLVISLGIGVAAQVVEIIRDERSS